MMVNPLAKNAVAIQKNTLIEVFLILCAAFYMLQSIKKENSYQKRWWVTARIKLENYIF